jgi:protein-tyrosine phosphatase
VLLPAPVGLAHPKEKIMFIINNESRGRLAIVPRPRGGDWLASEVANLKADGVDVVVSLLEPAEAVELGLADEGRACAVAGIEFVTMPIPDRGVPTRTAEFVATAEHLRERLAAGATVGIHCRACIGRSSMLAAVILVLHGVEPTDAWIRIEKARGIPVPDTAEQRRWVEIVVERFR